MQIWKRTIKTDDMEREVEFVNQSRDTRHGFAHDTTMFVDGREMTSATCHYLNRTWECFQYQSVMLTAVRQMINCIEKQNENKLKELFDWKKLTPPRKEQLKEYNKNCIEWIFYQAVYDALNER